MIQPLILYYVDHVVLMQIVFFFSTKFTFIRKGKLIILENIKSNELIMSLVFSKIVSKGTCCDKVNNSKPVDVHLYMQIFDLENRHHFEVVQLGNLQVYFATMVLIKDSP